jgi:DNA-binding NarL/FixJ family response regulator
MKTSSNDIRVMLVDDDEFSLTILGESLQQWATVFRSSSVAEAIASLDLFDPHVVVTDLNFNGGPDGSQLLWHLQKEFPWVGRVILTSHSSPVLALGKGYELPPETVYLVKADVSGGSVLKDAVLAALRGAVPVKGVSAAQNDARIVISKSQAEVLKLIAAGRSNAAIAKELEISLRAAESLIQRTFAALQLKPDEDSNIRVLATRMWIEGRVASR